MLGTVILNKIMVTLMRISVWITRHWVFRH